ncbi:MAG: glutamine-hydrolyzing GMP synthase, partial [Proteobacteria bacterium]|nr:glutamine-hydrolyzing GMP synthase [Pseudomonadota bacterium]
MILIIDFGSQYNQLIARRVRECKVYCHIETPDISLDAIRSLKPEGIILSGGPASIYEKNSPKIDKGIFDLNIPILGICYGLHYMVDALGGSVKRAKKREYGFAELNIKEPGDIFKGIASSTQCWMSHGDSIEKMPGGFSVTASTENTKVAAVQHDEKHFYGLQFHPEVNHTTLGKSMLNNFLTQICGCKKNWSMKSFARDAIAEVQETVGDKHVILGLSGGVDSSVAALLI